LETLHPCSPVTLFLDPAWPPIPPGIPITLRPGESRLISGTMFPAPLRHRRAGGEGRNFRFREPAFAKISGRVFAQGRRAPSGADRGFRHAKRQVHHPERAVVVGYFGQCTPMPKLGTPFWFSKARHVSVESVRDQVSTPSIRSFQCWRRSAYLAKRGSTIHSGCPAAITRF